MATIRQRPWQRGERPLMYGRDRELAQLQKILDTTINGHGSLVLISGEAGIGKTTLVDELMTEAGKRNCLVLTGGCYDLTTTPPYGPWIEAIRGYEPDGDQPMVPAWFSDPEALAQIGSQGALFEETRRFFAGIADRKTLVIVLEDLHWSEGASLEALRHLSRTLADTPTLLVVTYRDDELTRRHELYQLLPLLVRESQAHRIHLHQLDHDDIREMILRRYDLDQSDTDRLSQHVLDRSEGNPFFAEEILQGLEDDQALRRADTKWTLGNLEQTRVPMLLRQTIDARLYRLHPQTRAALQVAAVIGHAVAIDFWQETISLGDAEFDRVMTQALEASVLEEAPSNDSLKFRHALLREALHESLTLSRRRAWHRIVGDVLTEVPSADPATVAHHFLESGDPRAASWLIRAGVQAESTYALRVAADHYDTAQALLEAQPDAAQARGWLLLHTGHLLRYSDRLRGLAHLEDALHVAQQVDDALLAAYSHLQQGLSRCFDGDFGVGLRDMERGLEIMDGITPAQKQSALQAIRTLFAEEIVSHPQALSDSIAFFSVGSLIGVNLLSQVYVIWLAFAGRFDEAARVGEQFVEQATATIDDPLLIQEICRDSYFGLATAADWLGQPESARHWRNLALNAYEAANDRFLVRGTQYWQLQHLLRYQTDQLAERRRVTAAVIAANERAVGAVAGLPSRVWGLPLDLLEGRWDVARDLARVTLGDRQDPLVRDLRIRVFGVLRREQVDDEFAAVVQKEIDASIPDGPATEPGNTTFMFAIMGQQLAAQVALDRGELDLARDWITALDRWLQWSGAVMCRSEAALLWARYHHQAGDADTARQHAKQALEHATDPRQPLALIACHRFLGMLDTEAGDYQAATEHLEDSLDLANRCEAPYERALTVVEMAELAVQQREVDTARDLLDKARAICESLDARRTLERIDQLQSRLRARSDEHPAGLSDREVEVLERVAEGMTNAEAGEALYISRRTVAQHLRSVYNKLGVNSRAAAVARWAELNH